MKNSNMTQPSVQKNDAQEQLIMTSSFNPTMTWIARFVLILISFVWYSPHVYASIQKLNEVPALNRIENYYPLGAELETLRSELLSYSNKLSQENETDRPKTIELGVEFDSIDLIQELDDELQAQMEANLAHLKAKKQAEKVIARQQTILADHQQNMETLYRSLDEISTAIKSGESLKRQAKLVSIALEQLNTPFARPHESYSNDLDFIDASPRMLYTTQEQINSLIGSDAGNYTQTDSATIATQAINDKVTELGADPLTLYQWVHDNIRWVPSYGVMQGADYTLQSEQGNAFDTASLLISLLRAAGHETRYRFGTVDAPVDQMRNWVGNVKNAAAVSNLLSQGGIPQAEINYGGTTEKFRFEHVWVEVKSGNDWYPLDPSFKQYTYTEGMDLESAVSFDAEGLITQLEASSTSNEAEGWVQGVNSTLIETELTNYQTQLETYLTNNAPDATLGDVLGLQTIVADTAINLSEAAPQLAVQFSATKDQLPDALFHRFQYQVGSAVSYDFGASFEWGGVLFSLNQLTTELVGKDIALSFRPATQADEDAIESYLPEVIDTVDDLPSTLPAGTINMIGELTIDGEMVHSTPEVTLGEALKSRIGFIAPQRDFKYTENNLITGQYRAIGLDMQGISPKQLEDLQANVQNTQTQLEADNTQALTKHDVVGNILQAGVQGYLAITYSTDRIAAQSTGVVYHRQPSYGTFGTQMEVSYLIGGTPNQVTFTGVVMDIDRLASNVEEKQNCFEDWVTFNRASGMRNSAYEHQIPEQLFSTETEQVEGVSTAKALALATAQGQRIYTLTSENADQLTNITIDDGARAEIQSALGIGLEVTVHQNPISVNGWTGSGYTFIDAEFGVGAYKISGGGNGGEVSPMTGVIMSVSSILSGLTDIVLFLAGIFKKLPSVLGYIKSSVALILDCLTLGSLIGVIALLGVILIGATMGLGFIWVAALHTALSKFFASLIFGVLVSAETAVLGSACQS